MINYEKISEHDHALISSVLEATSICDIDEDSAEDEEVRKFLRRARIFLNH